jgi:hypothetical protein
MVTCLYFSSRNGRSHHDHQCPPPFPFHGVLLSLAFPAPAPYKEDRLEPFARAAASITIPCLRAFSLFGWLVADG